MRRCYSIFLKYVICFFALCALHACQQTSVVPAFSLSEASPGGEGSVSYKPFPLFDNPIKNLTKEELKYFHAGKALAHQPWVKAPVTTDARDGLGPLYNARSCLACHQNGGKSKMPEKIHEEMFGPVIKVSLPGENKIDGVVQDPNYGEQIQTQSISLAHQLGIKKSSIPAGQHEPDPEAKIYIEWIAQVFTYPDGNQVELRKPKIIIKDLSYGELDKNILKGIRNAPALTGMGLIEMIDQRDIDSNIDADDRDQNGISGRPNFVWDRLNDVKKPGRFGLKANRFDLKDTVAAAFVNDIGINSPLYPLQPCTQNQIACLKAPTGNNEDGFELPDDVLELTTHYIRNIGVPKARFTDEPSIRKGRSLFYELECASCHIPSYTTTKSEKYPHLSQQEIWPYSDFLLHDMGDELADGRPDFEASGNEWRTAPLWGVGLNEQVNGNRHLLHDGRARSIEEAILWHGGEAQKSKKAFINLHIKEREELLRFIQKI